MRVCIEGIDGSGKGTQARLLANRLKGITVSFPDYSTPTGQLIQQFLAGEMIACPTNTVRQLMPHLLKEVKFQQALALQALMIANKVERARDIEVLSEEHHVVLDRYWPSAVAYGQADGLECDYLRQLNCCLPAADLYLLLDIDVDEAIRRQVERGRPADRYERNKPVLEEVRGNYQELWFLEGIGNAGAWKVIDAKQDHDAVEQAIWKCVVGMRGVGP